MSKSTRRPNCTCPACNPTTTADGVFYCVIEREWPAYAANQFIGAYDYRAQADEALAVYRIDQGAAEADMAHDVQQAATDSDVMAALVTELETCPRCSREFLPTRAGCPFCPTTLPEYPAFLYYDRHQGGVVWAGSDTAYPSYIEAALARDGK